MKEDEIVRLLRSRDEAGAAALLKHYGPLMRYIIAPILSGEHDREDCLSEAAMRVWEKIDTYDPERGRWTAWLTAVARSVALNRARGNRTEDVPLTEHMPAPGPTPEEHVLQQERRDSLRRALLALEQGDRLLFYRKYYYRQPTAQIAAELGLTERAVEGRLYRIRKNLREKLGGEGYD